MITQASKEQVLELNAKLESLRMERGNSRGSAGNSLFGEVRKTLIRCSTPHPLVLQIRTLYIKPPNSGSGGINP